MTPEQREELKVLALKVQPDYSWREPWEDYRREWEAASTPSAILSLIAQVEALTVPQWQPIETAPQDGYMLVHEDGAIRAKLRFNGEWQHVAYPAIIGQWGDAIVGEDARRMLPAGYRLELRDGCCENPTHWKPMDAAPTIPAIPGTKEGA